MKLLKSMGPYALVAVLFVVLTLTLAPTKRTVETIYLSSPATPAPSIREPLDMAEVAMNYCEGFAAEHGMTCDGYKVVHVYDRGANFPVLGKTYLVLTKHQNDTVMIGWLFFYDDQDVLRDIE